MRAILAHCDVGTVHRAMPPRHVEPVSKRFNPIYHLSQTSSSWTAPHVERSNRRPRHTPPAQTETLTLRLRACAQTPRADILTGARPEPAPPLAAAQSPTRQRQPSCGRERLSRQLICRLRDVGDGMQASSEGSSALHKYVIVDGEVIERGAVTLALQRRQVRTRDPVSRLYGCT